MATYIDLDSTYRDNGTYPNPASYTVEASQVSLWTREARQTMANSIRPGASAKDFVQSVEVKRLILPYIAITYTNSSGTVINTHTADLQRIYLDVHTLRFNDNQLINSIDNKVFKARFSLIRKDIQYDNANVPKWCIFECNMDQVMRFSRNESLKMEIMQEEGFTVVITDTLPVVTKARQTYVLLELNPYFRDGAYDNHGLGLSEF